MSSFPYYLVILLTAIIFVIIVYSRTNFFDIKRGLYAALITAVFFVVWDIIFTQLGVWGFGYEYLLGFSLFGLPLEEIAFFVIIPLFLLVVFSWVEAKKIEGGIYRKIFLAYFLISLIVLIYGFGNVYTTTVAVINLVLIIYIWMEKRKLIASITVAYLISLITFIISNWILTSKVVWYNQAEIIGVRFMTIPIEDFIYLFVLLSLNALVYRKLLAK